MKYLFITALLTMSFSTSLSLASTTELKCYKPDEVNNEYLIVKTTPFIEHKSYAEVFFESEIKRPRAASVLAPAFFNVLLVRDALASSYKYELTRIVMSEPTKQRIVKVQNPNDPVRIFDSGVVCQLTE